MPQPISAGFRRNRTVISTTVELKLPSGKTATAHTYWRTVEEVAKEGTQGRINGKGVRENAGATNSRLLN